MDERVRFGALAVYTVLYIAVADVLTSLVPYAQLAVADPIGKGVDAIGIGGCSILIEIGALTGLTIVILVLLFRQSRIFYTMSPDGLLPGVFSNFRRKSTPPVSAKS